jgi:hypothetical protein
MIIVFERSRLYKIRFSTSDNDRALREGELMSNRDTRMRLFDLLSAELTELNPEVIGKYCCPICLELFDRADVDRLLTLEHIIPDGLGERLPSLTCKTCNNDVGGAKLDSHLHQKLAIESFVKGAGKPVEVVLNVGGHRLAANWERTIDDSGVKNNFRIVEKATSPSAEQGSKEVMRKISAGDKMNFTFRIASERHARLALLKAAYLLGFKELGYSFILHANLNPIRQQIQRPSEELVPIDALVVNIHEPAVINCVMEVADPKNIDGILVCLELNDSQGLIIHRGVFLPTPASTSNFFERACEMKEAGKQATCTGRLLKARRI